MSETTEIPIPDSSGSAGGQQAASPTDVLDPIEPLAGLPIVNTLHGLATRNSRAFGGDVPAALLNAATRQLGNEYLEMKAENRKLIEKLEKLREDATDLRVEHAVLEERIQSEGKNKHIRNLCITVGVGLVGVGYAQAKVALDAYAVVAMLVGILLTAIGWFSHPKSEKKQ
jgi:hypothetical protein